MIAFFARHFLAFFARSLIKRHAPTIIGITGTVGKTTTAAFVTDFIESLQQWGVYASQYHYNGEYGLPLTILRSASPKWNIFLWWMLVIKYIREYYATNYPKYLILEYGIDHPGEMEFLLSIVKPNIAIVLNIGRNHALQFPNFQDYIDAKMLLAKSAETTIVNMDNSQIKRSLASVLWMEVQILTYGVCDQEAEFHVRNIHSWIDNLSFDLVYKHQSYPVSYQLSWTFQAYNLLPVYALGTVFGRSIMEITESLKNVHPSKGRWMILKWANGSIILDGSYNGWFDAIKAWINYLESLPEEYYKILFLGDMRELGNETRELHEEIAALIVSTKTLGHIVSVGDSMRHFVMPLLEENEYFHNKMKSFLNSRMAGRYIRSLLMDQHQDAVIFVKWSQNTIFLEEGIKEFLGNIQDQEKLCRQSPHWMRTKEAFFEHAAPQE